MAFPDAELLPELLERKEAVTLLLPDTEVLFEERMDLEAVLKPLWEGALLPELQTVAE